MTRDGQPWGKPAGESKSNFHNNCDNRGSTLTVVKDTKGYVFGGYLSVSWTGSGGSKKDSNAWLFALNAAELAPTQLPFQKDS